MPALICASSALVGKTTTRPPGMVKVLTLEFNGVFDITFYLSLIGLAPGDLPPINRTSHISKKSITLENDGHENKQI